MNKKTKICTVCKIEYLATPEHFHRNKKTKDGLTAQCKECANYKKRVQYEKNPDKEKERIRKWKKENIRIYKRIKQKYRENNREQIKKEDRKYYLKKKYGITIKEYNNLFDKYHGCCWICGIYHSELNRGLFIDHNHNTGKIRGLLCGRCNSALGNVNNDPSILLKMIKYLESS